MSKHAMQAASLLTNRARGVVLLAAKEAPSIAEFLRRDPRGAYEREASRLIADLSEIYPNESEYRINTSAAFHLALRALEAEKRSIEKKP